MSMTYSDFYDIAEYGNENWKGNFTPKEIAENAYDYLCEFQESMESIRVTPVIQELLRLLDEDRSEAALYYANMLRYELKLNTVEK